MKEVFITMFRALVAMQKALIYVAIQLSEEEFKAARHQIYQTEGDYGKYAMAAQKQMIEKLEKEEAHAEG